MTDDEVIEQARRLCDRGVALPHQAMIESPRLRKIVSEDDAFLARYLVPAMLEIIERRGLKDPR